VAWWEQDRRFIGYWLVIRPLERFGFQREGTEHEHLMLVLREE
jgi:hypothetical protein